MAYISLMLPPFLSTADYITTCRIEKAQLLLISTDRPVKDIAYQIGFSSPIDFARVFQKKLGVTASRYRLFPR